MDVQINEPAVLQELDLKKYKPKWIRVESRVPEIAKHLPGFGYQLNSQLSAYDIYSDPLFACNEESSVINKLALARNLNQTPKNSWMFLFLLAHSLFVVSAYAA